MKKLMTFAALAMCCHAFPQFNISGTVKSKNEPLAGAVITAENSFIAVQSDASGNYSLKNLKEGSYIINAGLPGYEKWTDTLLLRENKTVDIEMKRSSLLMDEVIVNSTRADDKSAIAHTNLSKEDITKQNLGQDMPYLLNLTPSVVVTSDAGSGIGYTGIRIRGTDATRVNVTINGIPVNDAESQGTYWVDLPDIASSIDNIQIQRGVGTSTNGSGAFGGSLNIQTTKLNTKPYGELSNSFGSFNTLKNTVNMGTGLLDSKWAFDARLSKINSDGYIDRASSDLKSYYLSGGYYGKKTIVKAIAFSGWEETYQSWYGVPQDSLETHRTYNPAGEYYDNEGKRQYYSNQVDHYRQDYYQLHFSQDISLRLNFNAALHYTKGKGYYEEYKQAQSFGSYGLNNVITGADTITTTSLVRRKWLDNDFYGATFSLHYNDRKKLSAILGGAWNEYDGSHFGEVIWAQYASNGQPGDRYYEDEAVKKDFNIFAKVSYQLNNSLSLFGDLQYRMVYYSFTGFDQNLNNVKQSADLNFINPKIGLTNKISQNAMAYASYSVGNKEPSRNDYTQSSTASRPKHETLNDIEAGYKHNSRSFAWGINLYYMDYKNQLVLTGEVNDVGAYNRTNVDKSYRRGIELEAALNLTKKLKLAGNATFSQNKIEDFKEYIDDYDSGGQKIIRYSTTDIAFSPNTIASGQLVFEPLKRLQLSAISKYVGQQYLDNTSNPGRIIRSYFVEDLRITYDFKTKWIKNTGLNLYVNNILGKKYESNGYTYNYIYGGETIVSNNYYPQAGINFLLGLSLKF